MRIQWGLAIAVAATLALGNFAQAAGPKIDSVHVNGERDGAQISIEGEFDNPQYAVRAHENGRLIIIDVDKAAPAVSRRVARALSSRVRLRAIPRAAHASSWRSPAKRLTTRVQPVIESP